MIETQNVNIHYIDNDEETENTEGKRSLHWQWWKNRTRQNHEIISRTGKGNGEKESSGKPSTRAAYSLSESAEKLEHSSSSESDTNSDSSASSNSAVVAFWKGLCSLHSLTTDTKFLCCLPVANFISKIDRITFELRHVCHPSGLWQGVEKSRDQQQTTLREAYCTQIDRQQNVNNRGQSWESKQRLIVPQLQ